MTSLYGLINVPAAVWIDERGSIVRPPEIAWSKQWSFGDIVAGDDRYADAIRDWVENGQDSVYVFSKEELLQRLAGSGEDRPRADAHFKLAVWLHGAGETEAAARHWQRAQVLDPDNWNYHRQEWSFDRSTASQKFRAKYEELRGKPYYAPPDLRPRR